MFNLECIKFDHNIKFMIFQKQRCIFKNKFIKNTTFLYMQYLLVTKVQIADFTPGLNVKKTFAVLHPINIRLSLNDPISRILSKKIFRNA